MFILPPPPRYPVTSYGTYANGTVPAIIETSNTLNRPTGNEHQLVVGEGTYVLRDEVQLATPPPHPSEAPIQNPNPLATTPAPPTAGVKLSLITLTPLKFTPQPQRASTSASTRSSIGRTYSIKEITSESRLPEDDVNGGEESNTLDSIKQKRKAIAQGFGENNPLLASSGSKDVLKRRKPKGNIIKSNSSFISRVVPHEAIVKRLQDRHPDGLMAFININRAFQWLDLSSPQKAEQLTKILFTKAHPLCHDVNDVTKTSSHLDIIIGFSSADIIWYEPMSQKYARLNKNGTINPAPISGIRWIPGSENLFLAAHLDGSLIVYDKEKDDAELSPSEMGKLNSDIGSETALHIVKSVKSRFQKTNPVACWKLSNQQINDFAFSPDGIHLAVVSEDGSLRIIDYVREV
ncbi:MAG: hypothetical protein M1819_001806 [Sarea resinae]|nr:MAG: hypothetical protein M1819_001806 [Sarea resinae]